MNDKKSLIEFYIIILTALVIIAIGFYIDNKIYVFLAMMGVIMLFPILFGIFFDNSDGLWRDTHA